MFDHSLSCTVLALPVVPFGYYRGAIEGWLGKAPDDCGSSSITWSEAEVAGFEPTEWLRDIEPVALSSRRMVANLGQIRDRDAVAVISSFPSVTAALGRHISQCILSSAAAKAKESLPHKREAFEVDLASFGRQNTEENSEFFVNSVELLTHDNLVITLSEAGPSESARLLRSPAYAQLGQSVASFGFDLGDVQVQLNKDFSIIIRPSVSELSDILRALTRVVRGVSNYTNVVPFAIAA